MNEPVTLSELAYSVKSVIYLGYPESLWVTAEISELNINKSGHCYMELIEKEVSGNRIIARMRATVWANIYRNIMPFFRNITGYSLNSGIKVMLLVQPEFHEIYGLSLNVRDIDPSYTLGDIARRKQEVMKRLKDEGVIDMNKKLNFPLVPQRIAIISSETAAGYGDFTDSLSKNLYGFSFFSRLFPAIMQGEKSESSIINAFDQIFNTGDNFDVVVIIRGGGAQSELDTFNSYELALHICQFPIPVITGIGHERDDTIADLVAHTALKTPTAVAEFIISSVLTFTNRLGDYLDRITEEYIKIITAKKNFLEKKSYELNIISRNNLDFNRNALNNMEVVLPRAWSQFLISRRKDLLRSAELLEIQSGSKIKAIKIIIENYLLHTKRSTSLLIQNKSNTIQNLNKSIEYLNPEKILERGFTITSLNGKIIKSSSLLKKSDTISTMFSDGIAASKIESVRKRNKD